MTEELNNIVRQGYSIDKKEHPLPEQENPRVTSEQVLAKLQRFAIHR